MKKVIIGLLCFLFIIPLVNAKSFNVYETDINLDLGDEWYVFTRDNIKDNADLKSFNITEEYMENVFKNNMEYLDAVLFEKDKNKTLEMFIRVNENDAMTNLSNFKDNVVEDLAAEYKKKFPTATVKPYKNKYNWVFLDHYDNGKYLVEYITIVNGKNCNLSFQTDSALDEEEKNLAKNIVDKAVLKVDSSIPEKYKDENESAISKILKKNSDLCI